MSALEIRFSGEIQKVSDGRDTKHSWVDVTIRMPVSSNRLDITNENKIRNAFRDRNVVEGKMVIVDEGLWPDDPPPENEDQGELEVD